MNFITNNQIKIILWFLSIIIIYNEEHDIFWYENVWKMYPNIYFFLLQYFLLLFAIVMFLKSHKSSNQLKLNFWK